MSDKVVEILDKLAEFFGALWKVPKWRFTLAFILLGNNVVKKLKEIAK